MILMILTSLFTIGALFTVFTYLNSIIQDKRQMRKNNLSIAHKDYIEPADYIFKKIKYEL